jgi:hypothetical protein
VNDLIAPAIVLLLTAAWFTGYFMGKRGDE